MSERLDAALRYAAHGWPVFPCNGKRPMVANGFHDATTDRETVEGWWRQWPDANVAVPTGGPSGLLVVDVDGDEGYDSLRELEREHGELPRTASVTTPRGGQHFYAAIRRGGPVERRTKWPRARHPRRLRLRHRATLDRLRARRAGPAGGTTGMAARAPPPRATQRQHAGGGREDRRGRAQRDPDIVGGHDAPPRHGRGGDRRRPPGRELRTLPAAARRTRGRRHRRVGIALPARARRKQRPQAARGLGARGRGGAARVARPVHRQVHGAAVEGGGGPAGAVGAAHARLRRRRGRRRTCGSSRPHPSAASRC